MSEVIVHTAHPYPVRIQPNAIDGVADFVAGASKVAIVYPPVLGEVAHRVAELVQRTGAWVLLLEAPDGERAKNEHYLFSAWQALAQAGFTRSDLIIGLGGGATTDVAGFVAATWLRGIAWIAIPTTVLAMVDAGIGGKTGIDLPAGKNLVGSFHEPVAVLEDLTLLGGLPADEIRAGFGEIIKHGFIADPPTLELIERDPVDVLNPSSRRLGELIHRSANVKATVVSTDLLETTSTGRSVGRELLNYGHTLGHAIEAYSQFTRKHGECVGLGMIFASELSCELLGLPREVVDRHRSVLNLVGLPTHYSDAPWSALDELMRRDKKTRGATLRFVGLRGLCDPEMIVDPPQTLLRHCYQQLGGC